jgi:hypothetical protein
MTGQAKCQENYGDINYHHNVKPHKKANNGSGVLSLLLLFLVFTISFVGAFLVIPDTLAASVTMEVYQQTDGKAFGQETSLDIFSNDNHFLNGENLIAPFSFGSYTFAVYNSAASALLPYSILFEATNEDDIPLVFSIRKNDVYIFGGESDEEMLPLTLHWTVRIRTFIRWRGAGIRRMMLSIPPSGCGLWMRYCSIPSGLQRQEALMSLHCRTTAVEMRELEMSLTIL